jgi:hypothetical protein
VAQNFGQRKDEIDAQDAYIAKAADVLEAIKSLEGETFTGGQVAGKLGDSEAWAYTFASIKGLNDVIGREPTRFSQLLQILTERAKRSLVCCLCSPDVARDFPC